MNTQVTLQDLLNQGSELIQARRLPEAQALCEQLLAQLPDNPDVRFFASDVESLRNDPVAALAHLDALRGEMASAPRIVLRKAQLKLFAGERAAALDLARTVSLEAMDERRLLALGRLFMDARQLAEAHSVFRTAFDRFPDSADLLYLLTAVEAQLDENEAAETHVEQLLKIAPGHAGAVHLRSQLRAWSAENNHVEELRQQAESSEDQQLKAVSSYALGKEQEDLGNYSEALHAYRGGAREFRKLLSYDSEGELAAQREIRETFSRSRFEALAPGCADSGPIFLVGMPHSGIRVAERVLHGHSAISSVGESAEFRRLMGVFASSAAPAEASDTEATLAIDFADLGERYLATSRDLAPDSPLFIDSTSFNFLYCGHIFAALPNARIIHLFRDPLDSCFSAFKNLFFGAHSFSYQLDELVAYYASYREHMRHWHALFPGQILDVSYEGLVRDTPSEARRMLDFCDLPWEDAMLETDPQAVLNPMSASKALPPLHEGFIGSAEKFGTGLDDFRRALEELETDSTAA